MKKINKDDIVKHAELNSSLEMTRKISKDVEGYVCHEFIHILYVLKELMGESCKNYLEIGTHNGGSLIVVMQSAYKTNFFGLDIWTRSSNMKIANRNIVNHNTYGHSFELIKGNSMKDIVFANVKNKCPQVDLLFIDGGHSFKNVINDFERYSQLVPKNGIIVFDDYLYLEKENHPHSPEVAERKMQVRRAVDHLVNKYGHLYNIIGTVPNIANAKPRSGKNQWHLNNNVSYIMQKKL
jgi:predicted O-methyltransferase YrrM